MKCSNCNQENNQGDLFCSSCGNKLIIENNLPENNYTNNQTKEQNFQNNINTNNINQTKPKTNKWLIIGIIIAAVIGLIIFTNNDNSSYNSAFQREDDKTKFENYLTHMGFTKTTNNKYTLYSNGYTYVIDFSEDLFSQKGDTSYNVYYYQKDVFGTALVSGSFKTIATYTYNTYDYNCKTEPSTYQSYACSYMQSTITELAKTMKKTFYKFINEAGVSVYNL